MGRTFGIVLVAVCGPVFAADKPIPPRLVANGATVADTVKEMNASGSGAIVELGAGIDPTAKLTAGSEAPFWAALEKLAIATSARIAISKQGRTITMVPRTGPVQPASVDGPFRVAVRQVSPRFDFETGKSFTDIHLDIHWEPRFPVFRIDGQPEIAEIADDRNSKITAVTAKAKSAPSGYHFATSVRVDGIPRTATKIAKLAGQFTVTAAEKMLPFEFDLGGPFPATPADQLGVSASLKRFDKIDNRWDAHLELKYPPQPEFESFESWVTENRARLISPNGRQMLDPTDYDIPEQGRRVRAVYRFPAAAIDNPKGWKLRYETPALLVEYPVRFRLVDIELP